jgi:hypothetical protein
MLACFSLCTCALALAACERASAVTDPLDASVSPFRIALSDQSASVMPLNERQDPQSVLFRRIASSSSLRAAREQAAVASDPPLLGLPPGSGSSASSDGIRSEIIHTSADARSCNASLLNIFGARLSCGNAGFTIPILYNGDCPISACILQIDHTDGPVNKWLDF